MEQFNDTAIVNGVAYPKVTLEPKTYRFRVLNAANDRFFNLQWYLVDPSTGTAERGRARPAAAGAGPDRSRSSSRRRSGPTTTAYGPDWIQIGTEGGFLPAPTVVDGQQPTTWITDPTRFDVGNVDLHSLLLAPGRARRRHRRLLAVRRPDPDPVQRRTRGLPGARAVLRLLHRRARHGAERRPAHHPRLRAQHPHRDAGHHRRHARRALQPDARCATPSATRPTAPACSSPARTPSSSARPPTTRPTAPASLRPATATRPTARCNICDGLVRVNDTMTFGFNTLKAPTTKTIMPLQPKAIHDEMNSSTFDEFGRMQSNLGLEAQPPTPAHAERHPLPVHQPGDRAARRHQPAEGSRSPTTPTATR